MILEGFDIENWACIKKLSVTGLPSSGVIVFHGPNRTGKSSLVQALRACLIDYASTSTALKSFYPRGTGDKPTVTVTFTVHGTTYRIKKCFGTNRSELASRTAAGGWKVESTSAADAHARTCELVGGDDSSKGLHQLLWLTQAEFQLPKAKEFDTGLQSQLRGILGVLQTPLDDRFIERVKKRWSEWHSGQRKPGQLPKIKDSCQLSRNLRSLEEAKQALADGDQKFLEIEGLVRETENLELRRNDLAGQLATQEAALGSLQELFERSRARIAARKFAEEQHANAEREIQAAEKEQQDQVDAAKRLADAEVEIEPAQAKVDSASLEVASASQQFERLQKEIQQQRDSRRTTENLANRVAAKVSAQTIAANLEAARHEYERAAAIADEIQAIEKSLADHPAPDEATLNALKANRNTAMQLKAELKAALMTVSVNPLSSSGDAEMVVDDAPPFSISAPREQPVRRRASLRIPSWGQIDIRRGAGSGDLDQTERDLQACENEFAKIVNPLGVSATDPNALDLLVQRAVEYRQKLAIRDDKKKELRKIAPNQLTALQKRVVELEAKLADLAKSDPIEAEPLPTTAAELDNLAKELKDQLAAADATIKALDGECREAQANVNAARGKESAAREALAIKKANVSNRRDELARLRTAEQIAQRLEAAKQALAAARKQLQETELSAEEATINERLATSREAVNALVKQLRETEDRYNRLKGRLQESEGLHARRAALAARVEELTRLTDRENLERVAVDRLYELFEACREKQLGTLMSPIHDRVLTWMRVLDIGDYQEVRFNDAFLPDTLVRSDGTAEFTIDEESTGAQEQIGMLVRLALGSLLTSGEEPAVAILDDPLTHCDVGRLNKMRAILRRAAEGEPKSTPPAGPLQIIVLTCHPEWFRDERATVIDLEADNVLQRFPY
jgi:DNA repair exonuclease SbcCD ATPase subunit